MCVRIQNVCRQERKKQRKRVQWKGIRDEESSSSTYEMQLPNLLPPFAKQTIGGSTA